MSRLGDPGCDDGDKVPLSISCLLPVTKNQQENGSPVPMLYGSMVLVIVLVIVYSTHKRGPSLLHRGMQCGEVYMELDRFGY